ncbi:ABC transporter ATP-binding protein [Natronosalvus halobius]|uniref:ABC transporter ATP-binding protein n=1 Tax=Natronosalvus halobius TaxID=2953746 RepID=UPI0020A12C5D|nr:ABC transporter ATP-binding protein [Natronosalvus halobius]USZ73663.1 ABC transporter ATP-binding protein [Natronosalvus halobius]
MTDPLLEIDDLRINFNTEDGVVKAIDGVNLTLDRDEVLGIIGESGCGKTVTVLSIMRLLQSPPAEVVSGTISFEGRDLLSMGRAEIDDIRGDEIAMVYQDPMTSLNPVLKIGYQIREPIHAHYDVDKAEARTRAVAMLKACEIADPERVMDSYPHSLSGGMRQRVVIAMALINEPKLLIADEPTTALDVTVQAKILDVLRDLQEQKGMSMLFITHDLPVVSELADRIAVMYAGNVVETCPLKDLFENALHPYTRRLTESIPDVDETAGVLPAIEGSVPSLINPPSGCRFAPRCPQYLGSECDTYDPELRAPTSELDHDVACHLYTEIGSEDPPWEDDVETYHNDETEAQS